MSFAIGSLRPRAALAPLQNASCQCRHASSRSITVRLVRTIDGLGKGNELVQVNPGRMRHSLFPEGKAVYVPWKRKSVLKAMIADKNASSSLPTAPNPQTTQTPSAPLLSKSEWTTTSSLIPLSFTLPVPASSSTETLFGSIHPSDLARYFQFELQAENQIPVESLDFAWTEKEKEKGRVEAGERVRKLGRYTYTVGVKGDRNGSMKVEREVELVPQEAPSAAATS